MCKDMIIKYLDRVIGYVICLFVTYLMFYYVCMPRIIERRSKDLGLFEYDYKKDKHVAKDSISLNSYEFHYIQYGNLDEY